MRHFFNAKPEKAAEPPSKPTKAPHETNALMLFAQANQNKLSLALKSELSERGLTPMEGNFKLSREIKKTAFEQLSDAEKTKYETEAAEHNEKVKDLPPVEHIFE